ncbi:MAG TPA: hypothetical protein VHK27_00935 [Gammaproteobacteria bacterium]|nr:hypothetical protein [Gammaproteobacteria bacterium]
MQRIRRARTPGPKFRLARALARMNAAGAAQPTTSFSEEHKLHVICERDVGLFSLIQQVIANIPWAISEDRVPIVYFGERTSYWTPNGYMGKDTVWEYYFEPIVADYPAATIPDGVRASIARNFPSQSTPGYFVDERTYVSNHFGDHPLLDGMALRIPYMTGNPDDALRRQASSVVQRFIRPRTYISDKVNEFFDKHMKGEDLIGVHVRGTDAASEAETRGYRQGSLNLPRYVTELRHLVTERSGAKILVATDEEASLDCLKQAFGSRVISYNAIRHEGGEVVGRGPTGCIMPAYIGGNPDRAARNGEEAVIEHLLLARCNHLVHNGASLATTVLLKEPSMSHTNTHRGA